MQPFEIHSEDGGILVTKWSVYLTFCPLQTIDDGIQMQRALKLEYPFVSSHSMYFDETGRGVHDLILLFEDIEWYVTFTHEFREWFFFYIIYPNERPTSQFRRIDEYGDFRYSMLLIPSKNNRLSWIFFAPLLNLVPRRQESVIRYRHFSRNADPYISNLHPKLSLANLFLPKKVETYPVYYCMYLFGEDSVSKFS